MKSGKKIILLIILVNLLTVSIIWTQETSDIRYMFTETDSGYTFSGSFMIKTNPDCILNICFSYEHIKALAPDAKEVQLMEQGNNWNKISYTYQKYIYFENKSLWHRTLDHEKQRVDFTLIKSENNLAIMPKMISSSGFYRICKKKGNYRVEYFQQCQLEKSSLTNLYLNRLRKEAIQFIHSFSDYITIICVDS